MRSLRPGYEKLCALNFSGARDRMVFARTARRANTLKERGVCKRAPQLLGIAWLAHAHDSAGEKCVELGS